jgi:hypothetical protein
VGPQRAPHRTELTTMDAATGALEAPRLIRRTLRPCGNFAAVSCCVYRVSGVTPCLHFVASCNAVSALHLAGAVPRTPPSHHGGRSHGSAWLHSLSRLLWLP